MSSDLHKHLFKGKMGPPPPRIAPQYSDLSKLSWKEYFDEKLNINIEENSFRVYLSGSTGPLFVLLHGAGHSALSWGLVAKHLKQGNCRVLAYDSRNHGGTMCKDSSDWSAFTLSMDCIQLVSEVYREKYVETEPNLNIIIVGHSMGGAIATRSVHLAQNQNDQNLSENKKQDCELFSSKVVGLIVIDVVEGTAMEALPSMTKILDSFPKSFHSVSEAISWAVSSNTVRNVESAQLSVPSQIYKGENDRYYWKANLRDSKPFWEDWFLGLSCTFLACKVLKMLLLAGTDRLDRDLTVAQMQGKFQLGLLPQCGHIIQEDDPKGTSEKLLDYALRYRF